MRNNEPLKKNCVLLRDNDSHNYTLVLEESAAVISN